jgi:hypothetical protein
MSQKWLDEKPKQPPPPPPQKKKLYTIVGFWCRVKAQGHRFYQVWSPRPSALPGMKTKAVGFNSLGLRVNEILFYFILFFIFPHGRLLNQGNF